MFSRIFASLAGVSPAEVTTAPVTASGYACLFAAARTPSSPTSPQGKLKRYLRDNQGKLKRYSRETQEILKRHLRKTQGKLKRSSRDT
eukprot:7053890-Pyramimonas_sp.AAC.1